MQGEQIAAQAAAVGIPSELHHIEGAGHGFTNIPIFSLEASPGVTLFDRIVQFLFVHLANVDHFKCYKANRVRAPFGPPTVVELSDQFGINDGAFRIKKPFLLCNPAEQDDTAVRNPAAHLVCYKVKGPALPRSENLQVQVRNSFGELHLELDKPWLLCVPSSKTVLPE
jgi:hypothetical protein